MQETTYPIHDILTENEQLTVLRLINALNQWLENDDSSSLLVSACSGILSGSSFMPGCRKPGRIRPFQSASC